MLESTARETGDVRVVFVSSSAHSWCTWEPDNMNGEREYGRMKFYPKSKLYNVSLHIQWDPSTYFFAETSVCSLTSVYNQFPDIFSLYIQSALTFVSTIQIMTAHALQRRLSNVGITFSSLHPGIVR